MPLPTLRTFDMSKPVEAYYAAKDETRAQGLQDYAVERQRKADTLADEQRPGLLADIEQKRRIAGDTELQAVGQRELLALNPDSPTFDEDVFKSVDNYTNEMQRRNYSPEVIQSHAQSIFQSGALTRDGVIAAQEKAGVRRAVAVKPPKERSRYFSKDGKRMVQPQTWNTETGAYEDSGDTYLRDKPASPKAENPVFPTKQELSIAQSTLENSGIDWDETPTTESAVTVDFAERVKRIRKDNPRMTPSQANSEAINYIKDNLVDDNNTWFGKPEKMYDPTKKDYEIPPEAKDNPLLSTTATAGTLPKQALEKLKEGIVSTFENGQKWTLINGNAERVDG